VFVFADVVLPLPVAQLVRWVDIRPDVIRRMLARIALFGPADAARAYPDLFPSPDAARMALKRVVAEGQSIRTSPYDAAAGAPPGTGGLRAECSRKIHWHRFVTIIQRPCVFTAPTDLPAVHPSPAGDLAVTVSRISPDGGE
jgi:hypothetical protein